MNAIERARASLQRIDDAVRRRPRLANGSCSLAVLMPGDWAAVKPYLVQGLEVAERSAQLLTRDRAQIAESTPTPVPT